MFMSTSNAVYVHKSVQQAPADVSIKGVVSAGQVQIECSSVLSDLDPSLNFYALVYLAFYRQLNSVKVSGSEASLPQHTSRPQKLCLLENDITYYTSAAGNTSHYELRHACEAGEGDGFEGGRLSAEALDEMQMRLDPEPGPTSGTLHFTVRLTLQRVTRADAGRYWCELTHPDFMPFSLLQPFALRSSLVPFSPPHPWRELETEAHMMHNVHMEGTETETETEKSSHPDGGRGVQQQSAPPSSAFAHHLSVFLNFTTEQCTLPAVMYTVLYMHNTSKRTRIVQSSELRAQTRNVLKATTRALHRS